MTTFTRNDAIHAVLADTNKTQYSDAYREGVLSDIEDDLGQSDIRLTDIVNAMQDSVFAVTLLGKKISIPTPATIRLKQEKMREMCFQALCQQQYREIRATLGY